MIGKSDGTAGSGVDLMMLMAAIIGIADPELPPADKEEILTELRMIGDNAADFKDHEAKRDRNGVHYFTTCSEVMGIWFGASSK